MKTPKKASPARSLGPVRTPIRHKRQRTFSVSSARSSASVIISAVTQQRKNYASFVVSPLGSRKSVLSDNTDIEEPRRKSWWTNLGEHSTTSRDIVQLLEANENLEPNNIIEELDMEILSQENKKNYTLELPESSDSESINSIVITQRKLFPQKNQKQQHFAQIVGPRESLAKQHVTGVDKTLVTGTRELFKNKQRSRPIFPAALLNISHNKTEADKTKEFLTAEPKAQVRNIFGQRNTKRKNIFTNFIVTESDDEIPDIQPTVFGFRKTIEAPRRSSLRGLREPSPASSITTDMDMDDWKMLPSSTMVENQLEVLMTGQTPKRARLSNLTEKESEAGSNASKPSNNSNSSKEDKSRKSKTFTKEKEHEIDLEKIVECDYETAENIDKSRKSKTFTKEKAGEHGTDNEMFNKSTTLLDDNENQNKSTKDTTKSRKSKTFIKEIVDLETSRTSKNKSKVQPDDIIERKSKTKISEHNTDDIIENKSKTKISEHNTSMKTRSQSKNASPNNSQVIEEADLKSQTTNKTMSRSKGLENIQEDNSDEEEKNDEELNFSLHYENDHDDEEVIPETRNKSMTQKDVISADSGQEDKTMPNKVDEPVKVKSIQDKNISKGDNIETNLEQGDQSLHVSRNDPDEADNVELEQKTMNKSKAISPRIENEDEHKNESGVAPDEVDNASDNEEENSKQNEIQAADEIDNESDNEDEQEKNVEQNEADNASDNEVHDLSLEENEADNASDNEVHDLSLEQNEADNASDNEVHDLSLEQNEADNASDNEVHDPSLEQNQSEPENESQEVEDDNEENQNKMHEFSDTELNESQVQNESDREQNESQIQNESNIQEDSKVEHNESQEVDEEQDSDAEQNESDIQDEEQNESEDESEAVLESDNENEDYPDNSEDKVVDSENQEESAQLEMIETPNVSYDTTGRNRMENKSPEAVLHQSRDLKNSYFSVKGDKTVRKTEMPKSTHRDLIPARESAGFSDGSTSSAQGSGWDSHRTTRKTLRQTYGRDFTPRKSLRALVMEKSAKRQTQHNEMASVTTPMFPQANSTEMPSTRFDDEDENENRSQNDISLRTRQTTIEKYLMGVAKMNTERRQKIEEKIRNSLNEPPKLKIFKIPATPLFARNVAPKPKQSKSAKQAAKATKLYGELPPELLEDLKYKPPKRFQPRDAPWATKHLYKFLEEKLEPKYQYKSRVRAERLVEHVYNFTKDLRRRSVASPDAVEVLKREMARLGIVKTHHDFYEFFGQFLPRDVRRKVMPDLINDIDLPREGVFSNIL